MRCRLNIFALIALCGLLSVLAGVGDAYGQLMPERRFVRKGNRQFERGNFERSIERYMQALQRDSSSFEAVYDLGNALFRAERFEGAEQALARAAADTTRTAEERADAFFNMGDVQFRQQNLQGALESFKNSLRLNPSDMEAKYNYAYTKKLLEQQQNDDQNGDGDNQNNDQNQQNQQNQQNHNQNNDRNNENGDNDRHEGDNNPDKDDGQQPQPQQGQISPEQLEAMLDAIQAQEDKTQDKVKERQGVIIKGKKNW